MCSLIACKVYKPIQFKGIEDYSFSSDKGCNPICVTLGLYNPNPYNVSFKSALIKANLANDDLGYLKLSKSSTLKKNDTIPILMEKGHLNLDDKDIKWEKHRSLGKSWLETLEAMEWRMPHMAALRNIRGFADSQPGLENIKKYLEMLVSGVNGGNDISCCYYKKAYIFCPYFCSNKCQLWIVKQKQINTYKTHYCGKNAVGSR